MQKMVVVIMGVNYWIRAWLMMMKLKLKRLTLVTLYMQCMLKIGTMHHIMNLKSNMNIKMQKNIHPQMSVVLKDHPLNKKMKYDVLYNI